MATLINANTSTGLITTADTSGVIQLQSAGKTIATIKSTALASSLGLVAGNGILENTNTIVSSYTIIGTNNGVSIGDVTISGASTLVTLTTNSQWKII